VSLGGADVWRIAVPLPPSGLKEGCAVGTDGSGDSIGFLA